MWNICLEKSSDFFKINDYWGQKILTVSATCKNNVLQKILLKTVEHI